MVPDLRNFCGFCAKRQEFFVCSAKIKFPNSFKNIKDSGPQAKGYHYNANTGIKISLSIAKIPNIPSTN
jgi:hypothetical protein